MEESCPYVCSYFTSETNERVSITSDAGLCAVRCRASLISIHIAAV